MIIVKRKQPGVDRPTGGDSLESYRVPIQYGPYMKYLAIIAAEPNAERQQLQISMPRMSFDANSFFITFSYSSSTHSSWMVVDNLLWIPTRLWLVLK